MTEITGSVATSPSGSTLTSLRDRVEQVLSDTGNATWSTAALDEAIRHALDEYTQVNPDTDLATLTLSAAGREISISTLSYLSILRVWWDYDSTDPGYPPQWRNFEVWPGDILYINDDDEPDATDIVRIWYTTRHTLNGLDSASTTTLPEEHTSLIVTGAAAQAALSFGQSINALANVDGWTPRRFNEWAEIKNAEFRTGLARIASRRALHSSGMIAAPPLDRWGTLGGWDS
jgi:hypothetical protein